MIRSNSGADLEGAGCRCSSEAEHMAFAARVAASALLDSERWTLGYGAHSATQLRARVLAAQNGNA